MLGTNSLIVVLVVGLVPIYLWLGTNVSDNILTLAFAYVVLVLPYCYRSLDAGLGAKISIDRGSVRSSRPIQYAMCMSTALRPLRDTSTGSHASPSALVASSSFIGTRPSCCRAPKKIFTL